MQYKYLLTFIYTKDGVDFTEQMDYIAPEYESSDDDSFIRHIQWVIDSEASKLGGDNAKLHSCDYIGAEKGGLFR